VQRGDGERRTAEDQCGVERSRRLAGRLPEKIVEHVVDLVGRKLDQGPRPVRHDEQLRMPRCPRFVRPRLRIPYDATPRHAVPTIPGITPG
jgi:hypothetical protein